MYEDANETQRNIAIALIVNTTRVAIYFIVTLAYIQDFFDKGVPYNAYNFLVPALLASLDVVVIILCFASRRRFWNVVPFVSIIAIVISTNTILGTIQLGGGVTFLEETMLLLGLLVLLLSTFELLGWIKEEAELMREASVKQEPRGPDYRSYDA